MSDGLCKVNIVIDTPYITVDKYCAKSGLGKSTVKELCKSGDLPTKPRSNGKGRYLINNALLMIQAVTCKNV